MKMYECYQCRVLKRFRQIPVMQKKPRSTTWTFVFSQTGGQKHLIPMPLILRRNWISASVKRWNNGLHRGQWFLGKFHSLWGSSASKMWKSPFATRGTSSKSSLETQDRLEHNRDLKTVLENGFISTYFPEHPWDWYIYLHLPDKIRKNQLNVGKYTSPMDAMCVFFYQSQCLFWEKRSGNVAAASRAMLRRGRCISPSCRAPQVWAPSNDTKLPVPVIKNGAF